MVYGANLRRCTVDGKPALFHRWTDISQIVPPSNLIGGHGGGVVRGTYAIVEMEGGEVRQVEPYMVNFGENSAAFAEYGNCKEAMRQLLERNVRNG